jgi:hypothetical protein
MRNGSPRLRLIVVLMAYVFNLCVPSAATVGSRFNNPMMEMVSDGTLSFIEGKAGYSIDTGSKKPQQKCLRGVKWGLSLGGIFKRYPAWDSATKMVTILKNEKKLKRFVKEDYKFIQLKKVKDVSSAPPYSIIVYGGRGNGHIEIKVPASHLIKHGFTYAIQSVNGKEKKVALKDLNYVYISDYIDAYPRNHPNSRIANNKPDNKRPLKAVFELRKM